jgi:N-acetylglucosaminyl-diphospho-decaprenol L-rhamnosyltransferase
LFTGLVPEFAVVIVNYRSASLARRCAELASAEGPAEVLVVDNASQDGSVEALRAAGLQVLARPDNDGFAAGVNAGFAHTTAPYVVVLNPDCEPRSGSLRKLVTHLEQHPAAGVAAPRLLNADGSPQPSAYRRQPGLVTIATELCVPFGLLLEHIPRLDTYRLRDWSHGSRVAHVIGAALAVRREAHAASGGLDESFFLYLEETEWQGRVRRAGFTIELVPEAEVVHLVRGGGEAALAPSPHYVASARRYLRLRGAHPALVDAALRTSITISRLAARAWDVAPGATHTGGARVRAWDALRF